MAYMLSNTMHRAIAKYLSSAVHTLAIMHDDDGRTFCLAPDFVDNLANVCWHVMAQIGFWSDTSKFPMAQSIGGAVKKIEGALQAKMDSAELAMHQNKGWTGCMQVIPGASHDTSAISGSVDLTELANDMVSWLTTSDVLPVFLKETFALSTLQL